LDWYEPPRQIYEPLVMFDEADDVVFFGGCDQSVVMIEGFHGRLGYQNVDAPLDGVGRDIVMSIYSGSRAYHDYVSGPHLLSGVKMIAASPGLSRSMAVLSERVAANDR